MNQKGVQREAMGTAWEPTKDEVFGVLTTHKKKGHDISVYEYIKKKAAKRMSPMAVKSKARNKSQAVDREFYLEF